MNLNIELYKFKEEIESEGSLANIFWHSPFLDTEKKKRKKKIFLWFFICSGIYFFLDLIVMIYLYSYLGDIITTIVISFFSFLPIFLFLGISVGKFYKVVGCKRYYNLRYKLCYGKLKELLQKSSISTSDIEEYVLPILETKGSDSNKESYSFKSFFKAVIPGIIVGIIVALFSFMIMNTSKASQDELYFFVKAWVCASFALLYVGLVVFKMLKSFDFISDVKGYKLVKSLLYDYLSAKNQTLQKYKTYKRKF
ncbi:hypothetical protein PJ311_18385 [Bacillus sp. CLL-7-23]|uniref:Uncharacterized protein n=1 Tax=Bacillus changyiensis TaxID=3004103 RepID=A0ABT4X8J4_9BACI|nr:hypothetical protein [Bacillus changyiensis]MDA1477282.1 hypothetical protein [Bacillus changyiensis]MDA7028510.1 hypothetical protein [Bacillus changyiensis]